jgi:hypothetical protein
MGAPDSVRACAIPPVLRTDARDSVDGRSLVRHAPPDALLRREPVSFAYKPITKARACSQTESKEDHDRMLHELKVPHPPYSQSHWNLGLPLPPQHSLHPTALPPSFLFSHPMDSGNPPSFGGSHACSTACSQPQHVRAASSACSRPSARAARCRTAGAGQGGAGPA